MSILEYAPPTHAFLAFSHRAVYAHWVELFERLAQSGELREISLHGSVDQEAWDAAVVSGDTDLTDNWSKAARLLKLVAHSCVLAAVAMANMLVGMGGFHRAELNNLMWGPEFWQCFDGFKDNFQGKRRYEGPLHAEQARHFHSGYGPWCLEDTKLRKASPMTGKEGTVELLQKLRANLELWLGDDDVQGGCTCCAMVIANIFQDILFHADHCPEVSAEEQPEQQSSRDLSTWGVTSRPQVGFVFVRFAWRQGTRNHSLHDTPEYYHGNVRAAIPHLSTYETKMLRLSMTAAWGPAVVLDPLQGPVWTRWAVNVGRTQMTVAGCTTHSKKRGATSLVSSANVALPTRLALTKHANKETHYGYNEQEAVELDPIRQLLMAPCHLRPALRVFSNLDIVSQVRRIEARLTDLLCHRMEEMSGHAMRVVHSSIEAQERTTRLCMHLMMEVALGRPQCAQTQMLVRQNTARVCSPPPCLDY